ncbi:MAG: tetratricopeptide repeat protein [Acidimicrobiia bacterium]
MRFRNLSVVLIGVGLAVVVPGLLPATVAGSYPSGDNPVPDTPAAIALFQERTDGDPNPINLTLLAQLHARRSRETGDVNELTRAEAALNQALAHQPNYGPAVLTLAAVQAAQHRFEEALATARLAQELDPRLGALAVVGDVLVATGDYQGAASAYSELASSGGSPGLRARVAHLDELSGGIESAILQTEQAAADHLEAGGVGEEAAWFQVRLGDLNYSIGNLREADRRYEASTELLPGYWSALAGRAKVSAARGDFDHAIELYEEAATAVPRPEIMVALGDLYTITGQLDLASDSYATVEAIAQLSPGVYDRNLALYQAENGQAADALVIARKGLEERQDIYGYDTLAWTLYHLDRFAEAREAMDQAMSLGTRDAFLYFHSGAIWLALGDQARAATDLAVALDLNRNFHPLHAEEAAQMLDEASARTRKASI